MSAVEDKSQASVRPPNPDSTQQELVSLFDLQLKVLADSYLSFFQERYVQSFLAGVSQGAHSSGRRKKIEEV
jgi:hypothetical protein